MKLYAVLFTILDFIPVEANSEAEAKSKAEKELKRMYPKDYDNLHIEDIKQVP